MTNIHTLDQATFVVTYVSDKKYPFTNVRKDGVEFETEKWALTLYPTLKSGFSNDYSWTLWTASDDVAETARELIAMSEYEVKNDDGSVNIIRSPRLAFLNGVRDFGQGKAKPNIDKTTGTTYRDQVTVWLSDGTEPDFGIVPAPRSKDAGNIGSVRSLLGITRKPAKAESAVKPADGDNQPF